MKDKHLQLKQVTRVVLMGLLFGAMGMMKGYAYSFSAVCETGQTLYYNIIDADNHYVELTCPENDSWPWDIQPTGDIILPESVLYGNTTYTVTSIGYCAFIGCSRLTGDLTIPNSVTKIESSAFDGCSGFTGCLTIPNSVISIDDHAFEDCNGFTANLTIPNSVISIGMEAFYNCCGFTGTLIIGNSVTTIGNWAFCNCNGITNILSLPNSVTLIGSGVFKGTAWYNVQPDGILYLSDCCLGYKGQKPTGELYLQENTRLIGGEAFMSCTDLTGNLTIPNSLISIGEKAFANCSGLTGSLTIPNSVTVIGNAAFYGCTGFSGSLSISHSVTSIENYTFYNCSGFTGNLTIPNSVTTIGSAAFDGCSGFTGSLNIPNSVITIGQGAFSDCSGFTGALIIPNTVTTIDQGAFSNCSGFSSNLTIPSSVTSIGPNAFKGTAWYNNQSNGILYLSNCCLGYKGQKPTGMCNLQEGTRLICNQAFYGCKGLNGNLTIPNSVTTIGSSAFKNCSGFRGSLILGNSVNSVPPSAFEGCINLENIIVESGNSVYDSRNNCNAIINSNTNELIIGCKNTIIPNSVTSIGYNAFSYCSSLTELIIPNSVTSIGDFAFDGCNNLIAITILAKTTPNLNYYVFPTTNDSFVIYVPYESLNAYQTATNWNEYASQMQPMAYTSITGYGTSTESDKWAFIASPLAENTAPSVIENMIPSNDNFDLYRFNQSAAMEWENWKSHANNDDHYHFNFENGQGYLYANAEDVNLIFRGTFNENETKDVGLVYDEGKPLAGWNLVGNPFPYAAIVDKSYYVMNAEGTGIEPMALSEGTSIEACTGIMVKATTTGQTVTFTKPSRATTDNNGLVQITVATSTGQVADKAIVSFNEDDELGKFYFGEQNANIYIPQGNEEYAIATSNGRGEMPLNFKAKENGQYAIIVNPENVEMNYLHLIDNMTGADIDLLQTPSYTFNAKTYDYESRFRLVFATNNVDNASAGSETFAFFANGNLIVNNEGEAFLQIFDMLGHQLDCRQVHSAFSIPDSAFAPGVYIIRLINGENTKVQKIVFQ